MPRPILKVELYFQAVSREELFGIERALNDLKRHARSLSVRLDHYNLDGWFEAKVYEDQAGPMEGRARHFILENGGIL